MKPSDFLRHAGRVVGYYPEIAKAVGGAKAGILLCQLFYRFQGIHQKEVPLELEELEKETGLTTAELRGARQTLKENGSLVERLARLEHKLYFSIVFQQVDKLVEAYLASCEINNCPPQVDANLTTGQMLKHDLVLSLKEDFKKKKEEIPLPQEAIQLSQFLSDRIFENFPKRTPPTEAQLAEWAREADRINRIDGHAWAEIDGLLDWSQGDQFWKSNILSMQKFRKQWNQLLAQRERAKHNPKIDALRKRTEEILKAGL